MRFELKIAAAGDKRLARRATTLHLMIAVVLCGMAAGCGLLVWLKKLWPHSTRALTSIGLFSAVCLVSGLSIAALTVFRRSWMQRGKRNLLLRTLEVALVAVLVILFASAGLYKGAIAFGVITLLILLVLFYESRPKAEEWVIISEEGVALPKGGLMKTYRWREVEGLILRHSILSIELSGNKLLQREIATPDADSKALEAFAKNLIDASAKERAENAPW